MTAERARDLWEGLPDGCPDFPISDWKYDVMNEDTKAGYWEWVAHNFG